MTARSMNITPELRAELTERATKNGTTFPVELRDTIRRYAFGRTTPAAPRGKPTKVNIAVEDHVWQKALDRAAAEGTKLSTAINATARKSKP